MKNDAPITCQFQVPFRFDVFFTQHVFNPANNLLREVLNHGLPEKLLIVIEEHIVTAMPGLIDDIRTYFSPTKSGVTLVAEPVILAGGETLKNSFQSVEQLHALVERYGLSRHSYLAAIGGGALLDVAGFAAATAHRGIRHVRLPTTTLSQADGGVGVKNALNAFGKKNFVGTFAPPFAVINDSEFLRFLPDAQEVGRLCRGNQGRADSGSRFLRANRTLRGCAQSFRAGGDERPDSPLSRAPHPSHQRRGRSVRVRLRAPARFRSLGGAQARAAFQFSYQPRAKRSRSVSLSM